MRKLLLCLIVFPFLVSVGSADDAIETDYFKKGNTFFDNGQYNKALENYTKAIELDPFNLQAFYNRGLAHQKLALYDQAIDDFTHIILLDPDFIQAYLGRGNAYFDKGRDREAIGDYTQALKINPDDPKILFNRGLAYKRAEDYEAAYQDLKGACDHGNEVACKIAERLSIQLVSEPPSPTPEDMEKPDLPPEKGLAQAPISPEHSTPDCSEGLLDLGDGTVKDCDHDLLWVRDFGSTGQIKNWSEAWNYVDKLKYSYCENWRLPTREELRGLSENLDNNPHHPFVNIRKGFYWTKEEHDSEQAWIVYLFPYAYERINTKENTLCIVLPVCSSEH